MLEAYVDESGHSSDPRCRFVGMGGLVATTERWQQFAESWQAALNEFIGGQPFHMRDYVCVPGVGVYKGWKEPKRRAFLAALVNAIKGSEARFVGCVVHLSAFSQLLPQHKALFNDPYYVCFQNVTHGCTVCGLSLERTTPEDLFAGDPLTMVYAVQEQFGAVETNSTETSEQGRAEMLWYGVKNASPLGQLMGQYSARYAKDVPALQAADLLAYEITKEFENRWSRPNDPMRWALRHLLQGALDPPLVKFFGFPTFLETLMDLRQLADDTGVRLASSLMQLDVKSAMRSRYQSR